MCSWGVRGQPWITFTLFKGHLLFITKHTGLASPHTSREIASLTWVPGIHTQVHASCLWVPRIHTQVRTSCLWVPEIHTQVHASRMRVPEIHTQVLASRMWVLGPTLRSSCCVASALPTESSPSLVFTTSIVGVVLVCAKATV